MRLVAEALSVPLDRRTDPRANRGTGDGPSELREERPNPRTQPGAGPRGGENSPGLSADDAASDLATDEASSSEARSAPETPDAEAPRPRRDLSRRALPLRCLESGAHREHAELTSLLGLRDRACLKHRELRALPAGL